MRSRAVQDGFALWDRDDRLVMCNGRYRAMQSQLGAPVELGQSLDELVAVTSDLPAGPDGAENRADARARYLQMHRQCRSYEMPIADEAWVLVTHKRTSNGGTVSLYTDITELKMREFDLVKATRRIEEPGFRSGAFCQPARRCPQAGRSG